MTHLRTFLSRLWACARHRQMDRDIDDEIAGHLAEATDEYIQQGLSAEDAHWAALRSFGGVTQSKEVYRQVRSFMWLEDLARDLRQALRMLRRSPGFTTVAVVTLALGIGMNTAVFSPFSAVLLRSISFPEADRLVWVSLSGEVPFNAIPLSELMAWRERVTSFERMVAYQKHTGPCPPNIGERHAGTSRMGVG